MKTDLDPEDPAVRTAVFGKVVEDFLVSDVGKSLASYAKDRIEEKTEKLKKIWPLRVFTIMKLQNEIELWEGFQQCLANAIMDGQQAMNVLQGDAE